MRAWNRRRMLAGLAAVAGAASLAGLVRPAFGQAAGALSLVATTSMIADALRQVGGGEVDVRALMGPGVDPHTYRQTRTDIVAMTRADAVFWHGLYLEAQLEEFFADLAGHNTVFALADTLPKQRLLSHDTYEGRYDPHVWMDPSLWTLVVGAAREALAGLRPQAGEVFAGNAEAHVAEIARLDAYAGEVLASVPAEKRVLVTAHDAFKYFGRAYDFEVLGIQGISTESEAGLRRIEEIVATLVERRIGAIFVESSVSSRNVEALIEGAAARGHQAIIGGSLFSDAMGTPGTYEGTYIGMIDHNVTTIARALGGVAPDGGLNGMLSGVS